MRHLLTEAGHPLTTNDIVEKLKQLGFPMDEHSNPAATVNAIGNRLVEQEFAEQAKVSDKKGKAWVRVKRGLMSGLKEADEKTRNRKQDAPEIKAHGRRAGTPR